jgi:hypothetical protein
MNRGNRIIQTVKDTHKRFLNAFNSQPAVLRNAEIIAPFIIVPFLFIFFIFSIVGLGFLSNSRAQRDNIRLSYANFDNYSKTVLKIGDHVRQKDGGERFDSDSFLREANKGKDLIQIYKRELQGLHQFFKFTGGSATHNYTKYLNDYLKKSESLVSIENDAISMYQGYVEPLKLDEEISVNLSGERFYMSSQPVRYQEALTKAINGKNEIITRFEALKVNGIIKEINDVVIKKFQNEVSYLTELNKAVGDKNLDQIPVIEQNYKKNQQLLVKEFNSLNDKLEDTVDKDFEELSLLRERTTKSYTALGY